LPNPDTHLLKPKLLSNKLDAKNMPLIKVQSSVDSPEPGAVEGLLKVLSAKLAKHLGKPESYVMTAFEPNVAMTFAGTVEPVCYIEVKSIGTMSPAQTQAMSQDFCQIVNEKLGVPAKRIYIEFADAKGAMWGWNSSTFG
jgi:phenylpyruvate tautomerase PptA (4-oxalocrotonate tautomerase family)